MPHIDMPVDYAMLEHYQRQARAGPHHSELKDRSVNDTE